MVQNLYLLNIKNEGLEVDQGKNLNAKLQSAAQTWSFTHLFFIIITSTAHNLQLICIFLSTYKPRKSLNAWEGETRKLFNLSCSLQQQEDIIKRMPVETENSFSNEQRQHGSMRCILNYFSSTLPPLTGISPPDIKQYSGLR